MNIARSSSATRRQHGVTLIELMVSITIGLFILIAIGTAYITTTSTGRQRENQSELNEPARIVMQQLRRELSLAGYVDVMDLGVSGLLPDPDSRTAQAFALFNPSKKEASNLFQRDPLAYGALADRTPIGQFFPGLVPVFGCDGAMDNGNTPAVIAALGSSPVLACGSNPLQNSLQVAYQVAPSATSTNASLIAPSVATGEGLDCLQQPLPATPAGALYVINRYFVQPINGINELVCQGSGAATIAPVARGVEEFVLRYQLGAAGAAPAPSASAPALIAAGGTTAQYVNAAGVALDPLAWSNVTAVEVCMVSATSVTGGPAAAGTVELQPTRPTCARAADGTFAANVARVAGDARLWKRFTSVVSVRNAVFSTPN